MREFRDLEIWKRGMDIVEAVYDVIDPMPNTERYGLSSQSGRAAVSVPANVAEGCARTSQKHFAQFLETSLGSTLELQTHMMIIERRFNIPNDLIQKVNDLLAEERKMLISFIKRLNDSDSNK